MAMRPCTGAAQYTGLITYEDMLENPIRNPLACARVMAIQEIGFKGEVVSGVALRTLDQMITTPGSAVRFTTSASSQRFWSEATEKPALNRKC